MDKNEADRLTDDILKVVSEFIHHFEYVDRKNMGLEQEDLEEKLND